jgi:methylenetetrahydrofolate dehydrogenase (NADP+)/methenyltetrahydrofolate cyclohydrolase
VWVGCYVGAKHKACADPAISGILCQLPAPPHLDELELTGRIDPDKDVDG